MPTDIEMITAPGKYYYEKWKEEVEYELKNNYKIIYGTLTYSKDIKKK